MIFSRPLWLMGAAFSLESLRRGYIGGSALSLFIIKEFGLERQAAPTLAAMRLYLELEENLLAQIPGFLEVLVMPLTDYHKSAKLYLQIIEILAESEQPATCQFYWEEGE